MTTPRNTKGPTISRELRVNQMIRISSVRVIDEEGNQLGVMPTFEALRLAQERGFDLVEVAPTASPPVTRLLDYGQYKYELAKREKEAKRKSRSVEFKELRLKPKIGQADFDTRVRRAIEFLEEGDRIKVAVQFRGRELTHPHLGRELLNKFVEQVKDHGILERAPLLEGKSMHITIASTHKPKPREVAAGPDGTDQGQPDEQDDAGTESATTAGTESAATAGTESAATAGSQPAPTGE